MRLLSFNIQNAKYAVRRKDGTYDTPVAFSTAADSIALEADYSEETIYGDGRAMLTIPNDKGMTGSLVLLDVDGAYEIAMGRCLNLNPDDPADVSQIKQRSSVEHAIYFEFNYIDDDKKTKVGKTWLYGVTSGRPKLALNQTTDNITHNNCEYSLTVRGVGVVDDTGKVALDANGCVQYIWQRTLSQDAVDYDTFGSVCKAPALVNQTKVVKK